MSFQEVVQNFVSVVTGKYFCFTGRTNRKSFWLYVLVVAVVGTVLGMIPGVGKILSGVWALALFCPSLGIGVRRLHDVGKTGWLLLLALIPGIGALIILLLCIPEGDPEANQYGEPDAQ